MLLLAALAAGCSSRVAPMTQPGHGYAEAEDEAWLLAQANLAAAELDEQGVELDDPAVTAYLTRIGNTLAPPGLPPNFAFRYHIVRSANVNAFALPQGDIFLNLGLLVQLDNEAQLAQVLAHEMTHVLERHGIEALRSRRNKAVAVQVASIATLGLSSAFASVPYVASVTSYRRDQEEEADTVAFATVRAAGYDPAAAASVYDTLAAITPSDAAAGESIYSTHPSLAARSAYTRDLLGTAPAAAPRADAEAYRAAVVIPLQPEFIRLLLQARQFAAARQQAERIVAAQPDAAWAYCAMAAADQGAADDPTAAALERAQRAGKTLLQDPDISVEEATIPAERERAAAGYRRCLELDPSAAVAHRGLGLLAQQQGDTQTARRELSIYLAQAPAAADRRYIVHVLAAGAGQ